MGADRFAGGSTVTREPGANPPPTADNRFELIEWFSVVVDGASVRKRTSSGVRRLNLARRKKTEDSWSTPVLRVACSSSLQKHDNVTTYSRLGDTCVTLSV